MDVRAKAAGRFIPDPFMSSRHSSFSCLQITQTGPILRTKKPICASFIVPKLQTADRLHIQPHPAYHKTPRRRLSPVLFRHGNQTMVKRCYKGWYASHHLDLAIIPLDHILHQSILAGRLLILDAAIINMLLAFAFYMQTTGPEASPSHCWIFDESTCNMFAWLPRVHTMRSIISV